MNGNLDPRLIDARLGQLSPAERRELDERVAHDPQLAEQARSLDTALGALEHLRPVAPPAGLANRIRARVAAAGAPLRTTGPRPARERGGSWLRLEAAREVLAVAAVIVLAVGVGVPSVLHLRERNQRIACAANLAQVGQAMQTYARVFNDSLPFTGWSDAATWQPTAAAGEELIPNRRHVFPLLAGGLLAPQALICPSLGGVAMPAAQVRVRRDFLDARNVSYAYQNMSGVRPTLQRQPDMPILGDDNPLFDEGVPVFDLARLTGAAGANSRSHRGTGQNLLTIDGRSIWTSTPNSGVGGDNIWTLRHVTAYTGHEGPLAADDSHLLK